MEQGIKRKLVGAGVLSAVAIIVLPQLSPSAIDASHLSNSVPLEQNIPSMEMPLPKSLNIPQADFQSASQEEPKTIPMTDMEVDGQTLKVDDIQKPVLEKTGQSVVWQIQVGSFSKSANAISLRDKLRKGGYKAFEQLSSDGQYTRVFVGPSTQKEQLKTQMAKINSQFKLKGQIVVFDGE